MIYLPFSNQVCQKSDRLQPVSYSDFTLKKISDELNLDVIEDRDLFSKIREIQISEYLSATLNYNRPLSKLKFFNAER